MKKLMCVILLALLTIPAAAMITGSAAEEEITSAEAFIINCNSVIEENTAIYTNTAYPIEDRIAAKEETRRMYEQLADVNTQFQTDSVSVMSANYGGNVVSITTDPKFQELTGDLSSAIQTFKDAVVAEDQMRMLLESAPDNAEYAAEYERLKTLTATAQAAMDTCSEAVNGYTPY